MGFVDGTVSNFGQYDECLNIISPFEEGKTTFTGSYCLTKLSIPLPKQPERLRYHERIMNISNTELRGPMWQNLAKNLNTLYYVKGVRMGLCIPSACTASEVEVLLNNGKKSLAPFGTLLKDLYCLSKISAIMAISSFFHF